MPARILVIEDNPANLDLMMYLIRAFGHIAVSARDGREGLCAAAQMRPDLILCDIHLPKTDGYEVVRRLKSDPNCCSIPTVAVTALAMVGDRDRVLQAGFDGYLAKPINPEAFVQQIKDFIDSSPLACRNKHRTADTLQPAPKSAKILVLDNVESNLQFACATLTPSGYDVITSMRSSEALELANQHTPDLILCDICMSEGNGYDFIRRVKANPKLARIPFVFLTSSMCEPEDRARALALGADQFLIRPIDPQRLLTVIESCLTNSSGTHIGD
ncbi:MAG: response regulator [Bryobacteraceae bacterium]|jgi:two-component system cell cycle response regulator